MSDKRSIAERAGNIKVLLQSSCSTRNIKPIPNTKTSNPLWTQASPKTTSKWSVFLPIRWQTAGQT